eukprot:s2417_g6.t1
MHPKSSHIFIHASFEHLPAMSSLTGRVRWLGCRVKCRGVVRCGRLASCSASAEAVKGQESQQWSQEAPLLVRASLVGASTAMMTPLFPVIGLNYLVFRHVPADVRMVWLGGTSMVSYSIMTLVPNAFYYAPVLLPFALGNGVVAGSLYLAADVLAGGPKVLAQHRLFNGLVPLFGPALGATTAMLVPYTYPLCWGFVFPWDDSFQDLTMQTIFNLSLLAAQPAMAEGASISSDSLLMGVGVVVAAVGATIPLAINSFQNSTQEQIAAFKDSADRQIAAVEKQNEYLDKKWEVAVQNIKEKLDKIDKIEQSLENLQKTVTKLTKRRFF